jgi:hypothetical protein
VNDSPLAELLLPQVRCVYGPMTGVHQGYVILREGTQPPSDTLCQPCLDKMREMRKKGAAA